MLPKAAAALSFSPQPRVARCSAVSATRIVGDTAGAAGGALLGNKLGKSKSLYTALGAGGGVVLRESL